MKSKTVVSTVLLGFVAATALYLVFGEGGRGASETPGGPARSGAAVEQPDPAGTQVIAYYFHGTIRCRTCLSIENTAQAVLEQDLEDDFTRGALRWRAVDFEQLENEHFAKEFELTGASLVLVKEVDGRVERWDRLEEVWELIGDDARFRTYVLDRTRDYLEES